MQIIYENRLKQTTTMHTTRGRGRGRMVVHVQSVPITTNVVSSNHFYGEAYLIQHYVLKFVSDLQQVDGFLRVRRFPPPI